MTTDREHLVEVCDAANALDLRGLWEALTRARVHLAVAEPDADRCSRAAYAAGAASTTDGAHP